MTTNVAAADRTPALKRSSRSQAEGVLRRGRRRPIVQFIPGPRLIRLACGLPVAAVAYGFLRYDVVLWLACLYGAALAGFCVAEARRVLNVIRQVRVRRSLPLAVGRGLPFRITWSLSRGADDVPAIDSLSGEFRDVLPQATLPTFLRLPFTIPAGESSITMERELRITRRGKQAFGPAWIRFHGRRRLVDVQATWDLPGELKVLPERFASRDELLKEEGAEQLLLDRKIRTRQHGPGAEFESLHEFRDGDDPRKIDWRATGRMRRPVVRRYQVERHRDVMIVLDCGRLMGTDAERGTKLDCAVDAALILARTVLDGGDRCGIAAYDDDLRGYVPPMSGRPSLQTLVDAVYDLNSEFRESNFSALFAALQSKQAKRSLIVVLSDVVESETSAGLRSSLYVLGRRHVVLFAALRTPALGKLLNRPMNDFDEAAEHAVAYRLLRDRRRTIQSMRHGGIHVLDVEPDQMTVPLVNRFLDLRSRDLL